MVSRESATLTSSNPSDHIPITGNHSTIVKFISHDDPGYRTVSNRLKDCIQSTREFLAKRSLTEANETLEPLNSLYDVPFDLTGVPVTKTFIGRREEIQRLKGLLPSSERGRRKVFVLCGLGGMGKTQLALEFARKHQNRFSAVFWINGRTRDAVIRSLSAIAERLVSLKILSLDGEDANDSKKQQRQADAFLEWLALKGNHKWLMIYDNVDKDTMMDDTDDADDGNADDGAYPVETFFPKADQGAIIVTTRLQRLQELGEDISLARMDPQDALQLLADNAGLAALQDTKDKFSSGASRATNLTLE